MRWFKGIIQYVGKYTFLPRFWWEDWCSVVKCNQIHLLKSCTSAILTYFYLSISILCYFILLFLHLWPLSYFLQVKAGTHWPNCWTSEAFGGMWTKSGTNLFGVFSCVGSFWNRLDVVCSNSTCEVWEGWLLAIWAIGFSDWLCATCMTILIGGVLANQQSLLEGRNTVCTLFFYALRSIICWSHVAPPAYCISRKRRMYTLLWS